MHISRVQHLNTFQPFEFARITSVLKSVLSFLLLTQFAKSYPFDYIDIVNLKGKSLPSSLYPTFLCESTKSHFVTFSQRHSHFLRLGSMPLQTGERCKYIEKFYWPNHIGEKFFKLLDFFSVWIGVANGQHYGLTKVKIEKKNHFLKFIFIFILTQKGSNCVCLGRSTQKSRMMGSLYQQCSRCV